MPTPSAPLLSGAADLVAVAGDSVRLTVTPPALPSAYDHIATYYRKVGIGAGTVWSAGPTYVGAQGVAGTVDVTGLTGFEVYEFVAVSLDAGGSVSLPSLPRRARPTNGAGTVFEAAMRALKAQLGLIKTADGYSCDVVAVYRFPETLGRAVGGFPAVFMQTGKAIGKFGPLYGLNSGQTFTVNVVIQGWCHPEIGDADSAQQAAELLRADIVEALGTDDTLGGTVVHAHPEPGFQLVADEDRREWRGVHQDLTITFRQTLDNAYRRVP
jgi:hypothetical protein